MAPADGRGRRPAADADLTQRQARALGDPTRYEIFGFLGEAAGGVGVRELTDHFGFNHNAIRQHLTKLLEAGLVVQSTVPSGGRGRPRLVFRQSPAAAGRWTGVSPYERLALLMSEMLRTGDDAIEVGRRAGRRQRLGPGASAPGSIADALERLGFEPTVSERDDAIDIVLHACPFATAALVDPDTVCALHLGLAHGLADAAGGEIEVESLLPNDPRQARCLLRLRASAATTRRPSGD